MKNLHFKSYKGYRKWLAHGHMNTKTGLKVSAGKGRISVFKATPGNSKIYIGKKVHVVNHK